MRCVGGPNADDQLMNVRTIIMPFFPYRSVPIDGQRIAGIAHRGD
jgi:hypothetical protein